MARRALLVGINDYRGISDLYGCVNDVTNLRSILKSYLGFTNRDIRVLLNERASKAGILARLDWLTKGAGAGDHLVFHYSGHGSQIRDRDGDELQDRMDELICPWDMDWDGTYITDDDLNAVFSQLPAGVLLEVFLDSCHSGTGVRAADLGRPAELDQEHPTLSRYLPPPLDVVCRVEGEEDELKPTRRLFQKPREEKDHILWAGCRAGQTSADAYINGSYNGAFTYFFCKHMRDSGGTLSRKSLLARVRASLRYNRYDQVPQLESDATSRGAKTLTPKAKK